MDCVQRKTSSDAGDDAGKDSVRDASQDSEAMALPMASKDV
jgi:hypothetical protein